MNWYRFRIELSAWAAKTMLCVFTVVVAGSVLFAPTGGKREYPLSMRPVAEHEAVIPAVLILGLAALWLCYWRVFSTYRGRRAYKAS